MLRIGINRALWLFGAVQVTSILGFAWLADAHRADRAMLAVVPRTLINATTGWIVEQTGWFDFFLLCVALGLPGMVLLLRVAPWNEPIPADE